MQYIITECFIFRCCPFSRCSSNCKTFFNCNTVSFQDNFVR